MLEQWKQFLKENQSNWSYGIVENLVKRLDKALKYENPRVFQEVAYQLAKQGIVLDRKGHLRFATEFAFDSEE